MKDLKHLDFTAVAHGTDRVKSHIEVWNDETCRNVEWITAGILRMTKIHDGSFQVDGVASKAITRNGRDHDGVFLFRFSVGGLQLDNVFLNSVILTGWINGGELNAFRVPNHTKVRLKGADYVPATNPKLHSLMRGRKVEITIRTVFPKED